MEVYRSTSFAVPFIRLIEKVLLVRDENWRTNSFDPIFFLLSSASRSNILCLSIFFKNTRSREENKKKKKKFENASCDHHLDGYNDMSVHQDKSMKFQVQCSCGIGTEYRTVSSFPPRTHG